MRYAGFIGASYTGRAPTVATDRCVNFYPEIIQGAGAPENRIILNPTPGLATFATLPLVTKVEALYCEPKTGNVYAATSGKLFQISSAGAVTLLGTIGTGPYSFASNPASQVMICSGGSGTSHVLVGGVLTSPGGTFLGSSMVDYDDNYFIVLVPNSNQFQISPLLDGLTGWSGLDFGSASGSADNLRAMKVIHREVWFFGSRRAEVYIDTGNPSFPFERLQGVHVEHGIKAPQTLKVLDNTLFWLGENERGEGVFWRAEGYTPKRISTHAVEYWVAKYAKEGSIDDAVSYAQEEEGHHFYVTSFPSANPVVTYLGYTPPVTVYMGATWVYDVTTDLWHEREYLNPATSVVEAFRGRVHCFGHGKHLVGDWKTGKIFEMSPDLYDDDGDPTLRIRVAPHINDEMKRIFYGEFRLNIQVGTGNVLDVDPHIQMRTSDDGGITWSNPRGRSVGKVGQYKTMVRWQRNGEARRRAFEVSTTMRAPCTLVDAYIDAKEGMN